MFNSRLGKEDLGELRLVAAHGLLRDFFESPVTSVSPGGSRTPLDQRSLGAMQIAHLCLFGVNIKYDRKTRRSSF
jgi:hypothetical protein